MRNSNIALVETELILVICITLGIRSRKQRPALAGDCLSHPSSEIKDDPRPSVFAFWFPDQRTSYSSEISSIRGSLFRALGFQITGPCPDDNQLTANHVLVRKQNSMMNVQHHAWQYTSALEAPPNASGYFGAQALLGLGKHYSFSM